MANSEDDPTGQTPSPASPRTSDLAERIRKAKASRASAMGADGEEGKGSASALGRGLRIGAEFVAAVLVGSGIGHLIDVLAGTGPWGLLIMFMVGFAAGILNVIRVVAELNAERAVSDTEPRA